MGSVVCCWYCFFCVANKFLCGRVLVCGGEWPAVRRRRDRRIHLSHPPLWLNHLSYAIALYIRKTARQSGVWGFVAFHIRHHRLPIVAAVALSLSFAPVALALLFHHFVFYFAFISISIGHWFWWVRTLHWNVSEPGLSFIAKLKFRLLNRYFCDKIMVLNGRLG